MVVGVLTKKDILSDNFTQKATDYHFKKYNESIGKTSCFKTYISSDDCMYTYLEDVKTKTDLEDRITYLNGFINYANNIDYKFIRRYENFSFEFITSDGKNEKIYIYIDIDDNNKYVYRTYYKDGDKPHLYEAEDGKLETFINNYMEAKGIILN